MRRLRAGKQAALLRDGWGDGELLETEALNRHYDSALYQGYSEHVHVNVSRVDESAIDFDLLEDVVRHVDASEEAGAVLVFLPGMGEILNLCERLQGSLQCASCLCAILVFLPGMGKILNLCERLQGSLQCASLLACLCASASRAAGSAHPLVRETLSQCTADQTSALVPRSGRPGLRHCTAMVVHSRPERCACVRFGTLAWASGRSCRFRGDRDWMIALHW